MGDPANKQTVIELKAQNTKKGKKNLHQLARLGDHIKIKTHLDDIGSEFGQEDISKGFLITTFQNDLLYYFSIRQFL